MEFRFGVRLRVRVGAPSSVLSSGSEFGSGFGSPVLGLEFRFGLWFRVRVPSSVSRSASGIPVPSSVGSSGSGFGSGFGSRVQSGVQVWSSVPGSGRGAEFSPEFRFGVRFRVLWGT